LEEVSSKTGLEVGEIAGNLSPGLNIEYVKHNSTLEVGIELDPLKHPEAKKHNFPGHK